MPTRALTNVAKKLYVERIPFGFVSLCHSSNRYICSQKIIIR